MGTHLSQNSETDANRRLLQSDAGNNATEVLKVSNSTPSNSAGMTVVFVHRAESFQVEYVEFGHIASSHQWI